MTTRRFLADLALSALLCLALVSFVLWLWGISFRHEPSKTPGILVINGNPIRCLDSTDARNPGPRSFQLQDGQWVTIHGNWMFQPDAKQVAP